MNTTFLKELYVNANNKNSLVLFNSKQLKESMNELAMHFGSEEKEGLIISYSYQSQKFLNDVKLSGLGKESLKFVDLNSGKKGKEEINGFKVENVQNSANLTRLEIIIETFLKNNPENKFIIFDSISALSVYVKEDTLQKFVYFLNNKVSLLGATLVVLTIKESTTVDTLDLVKQFSDKTYDFSEIYSAEIENVV